MTQTNKMRVSVSRTGDKVRLRASKDGARFTDEDLTQLQMLEYELTNTDHFHRIVEDHEFYI